MRSGSTRTAVRRSAAITRSYSSRSGWLPPAAWKMSRSSPGTRAAAQVTQLGGPAPGDQPHARRGGQRVRQDPGVDQRDLRGAGGVDGDQHGQEVVSGGDPAHQGQPGGHGASQAAHAWMGVWARAGRLGMCPPAWSAGRSSRPVDGDCPPGTPVGDWLGVALALSLRGSGSAMSCGQPARCSTGMAPCAAWRDARGVYRRAGPGTGPRRGLREGAAAGLREGCCSARGSARHRPARERRGRRASCGSRGAECLLLAYDRRRPGSAGCHTYQFLNLAGKESSA
jgi:hypothetical protein